MYPTVPTYTDICNVLYGTKEFAYYIFMIMSDGISLTKYKKNQHMYIGNVSYQISLFLISSSQIKRGGAYGLIPAIYYFHWLHTIHVIITHDLYGYLPNHQHHHHHTNNNNNNNNLLSYVVHVFFFRFIF